MGSQNFSCNGTFIHTPVYGEVEMLLDHCIIVDGSTGKILFLGPSATSESALKEFQVELSTTLGENEFIIPGFIDTHVHAPQYRYTGTATNTPLMQWLSEYAFPTEKSLADVELAKSDYHKVVDRLLKLGTTTATYFGTLSLESCQVLVHECMARGQRALVGKVSMDRMSPPDYCETTKEGLEDVVTFINFVREKDPTGLVLPCVTPRFIPTCSPAMLKGLGEIASMYDVNVQSHISESVGEVVLVKQLHPVAANDCELFQEAGLLTKKTVMAHGTLLGDEELKLLAETGTAIAHCPLSNLYFGDHIFRVGKARRLGVKVGLGTDIAGGYSPSMLSAMRAAVLTGQMLRSHEIMNGGPVQGPTAAQEQINFKEAFYLATQGGAEALGMQDKVGTIAVGKEFDALLISTSKPEVFDIFATDTLADKFEKFLNLGDDRSVRKVWVRGQLVSSS